MEDEQKLESLKLAQTKAEKKFSDIVRKLKGREQIYTKYCFKEHEKSEDIFLNCILKDLRGEEPKGTMTVSELWNQSNIYRLTKEAEFEKNVFHINKLKEYLSKNKKIKQFMVVKPTILNKKTEKLLHQAMILKEAN